jgi:hypothetical protein
LQEVNREGKYNRELGSADKTARVFWRYVMYLLGVN